jgi:hypothetical protein
VIPCGYFNLIFMAPPVTNEQLRIAPLLQDTAIPEQSTCCRSMFAMALPTQRQKAYSNLKSWGKWRVLIVGKSILFN